MIANICHSLHLYIIQLFDFLQKFNVLLFIPSGEGLIEMASEEITCSAVDGEATVVVTRRNGNSFPVQVEWKAVDNDAVYEKHYTVNQGFYKS